ncbi:MAG: pilus assembly protein TadG-related protein [bacterium]|nr:pilus assembly protein TadG-related protein [bacterium]
MISCFARQINKLGRDEGGQSLAFVALVLLVLVAFMAVTVNVGHQVNTKIEIQNAADAAAVSGASWLARGYNLVAGLNQGMVVVVGTIILIIATWVLLTICVGIPYVGAYCATPWSIFNSKAPDAIKRLWKIARAMANLQDDIVKYFPIVAEAEVYRITRMNKPGAIGIPYPFIPTGNPENPTTLTLHLERGSFKDILEKLLIPGWAADIAGMDETGKTKGSSTQTQTIGREDYPAAIEFEPGGKYATGGIGRKIDKKEWYYDHQKWSLTPILGKDKKCIGCARELSDDDSCKKTDWKQTDYLKKEASCCNQTYITEEWRYCKFKVTITASRQSGAPEQVPRPMKLSGLYPDRSWLAVAVTDKGQSSKPAFLPGFFSQRNPWGTLGLAQARTYSKTTKNAGDVLWDMDWEARLTRITALDSLFDKLGKDNQAGSTLKEATKKMINH